MRLADGVYVPPEGKIVGAVSPYSFFPIVVHIREIAKYAGAAIGTAVISYPAQYAMDASPQLGAAALIQIGSKTIFRGVVGQAPFEVNTDSDEITLTLFDDKYLMESKMTGQIGIGTQDDGASGFQDVGYEIVFNAEGRPNKDPESLDFNTGSTAVYWTLSDIMQFLFTYYVDSDVATVSEEALDDDYTRIPSNLNLLGQTALSAVDTVAQLSGQSWGLTAAGEASAFIAVKPGAGTERTAWLFRPKSGASVESSGPHHLSSVKVPLTIKNSRDVFQAVSSRVVKESTYSNKGDNPLLSRVTAFVDKEYAARWKVDVTKYAANNLGANLSSGSRPKPLLQNLLTRRNAAGTAYITAAEIAASPVLASAERLPKTIVWLSEDGTEGEARLCAGGVRIDYEAGLIDFEPNVSLMVDGEDKPEEVEISDWSTVGIWWTVVTVLELPESTETDEDSRYLPRSFYQIISKPDLVPEKREDVWLPDLSGDKNDVTVLATEEEETYVDISSKLSDAVAAALEASAELESPISAEFPFAPEDFEIGDMLDISGRNVKTTGREVITAIRYLFEEGVPDVLQIEATNITAGLDPEQFVQPE